MIEHHLDTPTPPARVVIVGASGFVGKNLTQALSRTGIETLGLSSAAVDLEQPKSAAALSGIVREDDALVLLSALTPDRGRDVRTMMRNLTMGEHLSRAIGQTRCSHIIYLSSDAVYADDENPVRESCAPDPGTFYGLMHVVRERMLADAARTSGIPLLILRPAALYGTGDTHNGYGPNRFVRSALSERVINLFGDGEEKRDHVFVNDLSRLIEVCLGRRSSGVLNVASGQSISFFELARLVAEASSPEATIAPSPRTTPITHRHFDIAAQIAALPTFRHTPLREGLAATVRESEASTNA